MNFGDAYIIILHISKNLDISPSTITPQKDFWIVSSLLLKTCTFEEGAAVSAMFAPAYKNPKVISQIACHCVMGASDMS